MPSRKDKFTKPHYNTLLELGKRMGVKTKFPYYTVIGDQQRFYLWYQKDDECYRDCASDWIVGREAFELYSKLKEFLVKDKEEFKRMFLDAHSKHSKKQ